MDKTARIILGFAIAIIYPILIFLSVTQLLPKTELKAPRYPDYPSYAECGNRYPSYNYDSNSDTDVSSSFESYDSCQQRIQRNYDQKRKDHEKALEAYSDKKDSYETNRFIFMLILALISMVVSYVVRSVRELAGGLAAGSAIIITVSSIALAALAWDSNLNAAVNLLIFVGFAVTTALLWAVDNHVPKTMVSATHNTPPSHSASPDYSVHAHHQPAVDSNPVIPPYDAHNKHDHLAPGDGARSSESRSSDHFEQR